MLLSHLVKYIITNFPKTFQYFISQFEKCQLNLGWVILTSLLICWQLHLVYLGHRVVWRGGRTKRESGNLRSGSIEVVTAKSGQRHDQREDEDDEGWDDEAEDAGVPAAAVQLRGVRVVAYEEITQPSHTFGIFFCLIFLCFDPVQNLSQRFLVRHVRATVWRTA